MRKTIEFQNVSFSYDGKKAILLDCSFFVEEGHLALLSGYSGSGKSTILSLLSGIIPNLVSGKLRGKILLDGEAIAGKGIDVLARKVATVLQDPDSQIVNALIEDEIAFGLENFAVPEEEMKERVLKLCEMFALDPKADTKTLSGGQKQKLIIASAMAMGQKILLLDEPLANLDRKTALELLTMWKAMAKQGYTILLLEHRLDLVLPFVDDVLRLEKGKVEKVEDREDFFLREKADILPPSFDRREDKVLLELRNVDIGKGKKTILEDISLSLSKGEKLLLLGENGCGKTTLLRTLAKLDKPKRGQVIQYLDPRLGQRKRGNRKYFRKVGVIYQNPNYQLFMDTVEKEVLFGAVDPSYGQRMLALFDLLPFRDRHPHSLSEGQKRRLAIASVMATRPQVVLLDEPTVGQDTDSLRKMVEGLLAIHEEEGNAMVVVSHDVRVLQALSDRVLWIQDKKIRQEGGKEVGEAFFRSLEERENQIR